jgi:hypothetical protein
VAKVFFPFMDDFLMKKTPFSSGISQLAMFDDTGG